MADHQSYKSAAEAPVSISHVIRTLRAYLPAIALAMVAVIIGYTIVAMTMYVLAPSQRVTSQPFRLEFQGAERGEYPNGTKFSSAEIISTPVLLKVYRSNELQRFARFNDYARSIFVIESNASQEALAREYQARLSDPKLTAVDRDRLQREYESKLASLSKSGYTLTFVRKSQTAAIPEVLVKKVLHDILREWTEFVATEKHVLEYQLALLSPNVVASTPIEGQDPIVAAQLLRAKLVRLQSNIDRLRQIPAAELVRTKADEMSLLDVDLRLSDIVRFGIDPLVHRVAAAGLLPDRNATLRFLETQLAYDQRQLEAQRQRAEVARNALAMYVNGRVSASDLQIPMQSAPPPSRNGAEAPRDSETVMPQLSESFIERIIQMTANDADTEYRQRLTEEFHDASLLVVPLQEAVAYDMAILELVRTTAGGGDGITREIVDRQLVTTRAEIRDLTVKVHELYRALSRNLNPSTQLVTTMPTPMTRIERSVSLRKIVLYGLLTCFVALPLIIIFCLIHNRIREEDAAEGYVPEPAAVSR